MRRNAAPRYGTSRRTVIRRDGSATVVRGDGSALDVPAWAVASIQRQAQRLTVERLERLELALTTATVEVNGRRMYRTRDGVPMEMPVKIERLVRAALTEQEDRHG